MRARGVLLAGALIVVAGVALAAVTLRGEDETPGPGAATSEGTESSPPPPQIEGAGPIRFVLADR